MQNCLVVCVSLWRPESDNAFCSASDKDFVGSRNCYQLLSCLGNTILAEQDLALSAFGEILKRFALIIHSLTREYSCWAVSEAEVVRP
jgi:hypothetical protein